MIQAKQFIAENGIVVNRVDRVNKYLVSNVHAIGRFVSQAMPQTVHLASDISLPRGIPPSELDSAVLNVEGQIEQGGCGLSPVAAGIADAQRDNWRAHRRFEMGHYGDSGAAGEVCSGYVGRHAASDAQIASARMGWAADGGLARLPSFVCRLHDTLRRPGWEAGQIDGAIDEASPFDGGEPDGAGVVGSVERDVAGRAREGVSAGHLIAEARGERT